MLSPPAHDIQNRVNGNHMHFRAQLGGWREQGAAPGGHGQEPKWRAGRLWAALQEDREGEVFAEAQRHRCDFHGGTPAVPSIPQGQRAAAESPP